MLHIILLILKIIGITILALLGLLLLILLMILFVPIRYGLEAQHGEVIRLKGNVGWLLHFINARFSYLEGKFHIRVRILCFTLFDNLKAKKTKAKKTKVTTLKARKAEKAQKEGKSVEVIEKEEKSVEVIEKEGKPVEEVEKEGKSVEVIKKEGKSVEVIENEVQQEEVKSNKTDSISENTPNQDMSNKDIIHKIYHKLLSIKNKIVSFFIGIKEKIRKLIQTASGIKHKISLISEFIKNEINKEGFQITFYSLKKILKHILPRKLQSRIIFGTGDPCSTGQALGIMGIIYSLYGDKVQIIPDFENKIFEGTHNARGRIRLVTILIIVIKLISDKRFKRLKNNFQIIKEAL